MTESGRCDGPRVAILNVVGLCNRLLGEHTPRLTSFSGRTTGTPLSIKPVMPALTCAAQATYLTGTLPSEHGIVGNGWYDRTLNEHHFWKQSNRLVGGHKIWEKLRQNRPGFRTANLFWWFNMYSSVDYSITPRPLYRSDGLKTFDVHSQPLKLRDEVKRDLGPFPFHSFWGPKAGIESSKWIAESAKWTENRFEPNLSLVYLPHLDYDLQRYGPEDPRIPQALQAIDQIVGDLIDFYEKKGVRVVILSEYGITKANKVIFPNRMFRRKGWLEVKDELGLEYLDCGGSQAFALTDHQIAHVYLNQKDEAFLNKVRSALEETDGVSSVLAGEARKQAGLDHERAGDLVAISDENAWFAYYHWEDDCLAPDFARCVDVHRKYGHDPAELFVDPKINFPMLKVAQKLIGKKLGFRTHMDLIPLDPSLVMGSHGCVPADNLDWPVLFGHGLDQKDQALDAPDVHQEILTLFN
ncbi:MAG: alkaline phosphatase family protein [Opitutae bacterium]|nr:alkaline phosphatase family protein [Opitutae bacterium]